MPDDSEHDKFTAFVVKAEPELRYAANLAVGNPVLAEELIRRVLAKTAQDWRIAQASDPLEYLMNALDSETNSLWRNEAPPDDEEATEPAPAATPTSLADEAWVAGRKLRNRRWRAGLATTAVAAVIIGGYVWSVNLEPVPPGAPEPVSQQVTEVSPTLSVLPPPELVAKSARADLQLPDSLDVRDWTPSLADSPVNTMLAAYQLPNRAPEIIGDDGKARTIDIAETVSPDGRPTLRPRAISPDGGTVALLPPGKILFVDAKSESDEIGLPDKVTDVVDLAWYPDGKRLLLTATDGTYQVDVESRKFTELAVYGPATTFAPKTGDLVEFGETGDSPLTMRTWQDNAPVGEPISADPSQLPVNGWQGVPFADEDDYARAGIPDSTVSIPTEYGTPQQCVAVTNAQAEVGEILIVTDDYPADFTVTVLRAVAGQVFFSVATVAGSQQTVLVWRPGNGSLQRLFSVDSEVGLALGNIS